MSSAIVSAGTGHQLLEGLIQARRETDDLFSLVTPQALYDRPIAERHRIVFYIGHLEAFDWNLLRERLFRSRSFNPELDNLFAFGIDPVDGSLPTDQPRDWPAIERVRDYVADVRGRLDEHLADLNPADLELFASGTAENPDASPFTLLNVAVEHRLMHAETLAYMFHQLPYNSKIPPAITRGSAVFSAAPVSLRSRMIEIPDGSATLGLARNNGAFGWDNEFEAHRVSVPAFTIENHKVTNQQFLEFLNDGGYDRRELWSAPDWEWKSAGDIRCPVFWEQNGSQWVFRAMFHEFPLPMEWPVYVSHAEASAYARWAGKSLPTEAQWHRAAYGTPNGSERLYPWGNDAPDEKRGNFDFASWDPTPVGAFPEGASAFGVHDLPGNGWEWTSTEFAPFAGFKEFSFYPGYSANFFDGKHYVMKGGSMRTAASMLRPSFRNWFQAHYQYVYAGFRCVSN